MGSLRHYGRKDVIRSFSPDNELDEIEPENRIRTLPGNNHNQLRPFRQVNLALGYFKPTDEVIVKKNLPPRMFKATYSEDGQRNKDVINGRGMSPSIVWFQDLSSQSFSFK